MHTELDLEKYTTFAREPFYELAKKYHNFGMKSLDIGAGKGGFADIIGDQDIYLIDGNPETVMQLKVRYKNSILLNLPSRLPWGDGFFDLIHSSHLIEHLYPSDFYQLLTEVNRLLKPGGVFIVSTPLMWDGFYDDLSHIKPYNPNVLIRYFTDAGGVQESERTRSGISKGYKVEELVYRYRLRDFPIVSFTHGNNYVKKVLISIWRFFSKRKLGFYEKTAYTLVLRKIG